nr:MULTISPECIES: NAD(P)H-dependent oxidoreductase [unclassified Roseovarius]
MHTHIVHAHPEPQSFIGALTRLAEARLRYKGHTVMTRDPNRSGLDPAEDGSHVSTMDNAGPLHDFAPLSRQRSHDCSIQSKSELQKCDQIKADRADCLHTPSRSAHIQSYHSVIGAV